MFSHQPAGRRGKRADSTGKPRQDDVTNVKGDPVDPGVTSFSPGSPLRRPIQHQRTDSPPPADRDVPSGSDEDKGASLSSDESDYSPVNDAFELFKERRATAGPSVPVTETREITTDAGPVTVSPGRYKNADKHRMPLIKSRRKNYGNAKVGIHYNDLWKVLDSHKGEGQAQGYSREELARRIKGSLQNLVDRKDPDPSLWQGYPDKVRRAAAHLIGFMHLAEDHPSRTPGSTDLGLASLQAIADGHATFKDMFASEKGEFLPAEKGGAGLMRSAARGEEPINEMLAGLIADRKSSGESSGYTSSDEQSETGGYDWYEDSKGRAVSPGRLAEVGEGGGEKFKARKAEHLIGEIPSVEQEQLLNEAGEDAVRSGDPGSDKLRLRKRDIQRVDQREMISTRKLPKKSEDSEKKQ